MNIAFFGSSLVSTYWNSTATYYRGIIRALADRGHDVTFYEPDACARLQHRDIEDPPWATVVIYPPTTEAVHEMLDRAACADLVIKASGVGLHDALLERAVLALKRPRTVVAFWDIDPPATIERVATDATDPFRDLIPRYDLVLTFGGSTFLTEAYDRLGARRCVPIYNALDPSTHYPVPAEPRFSGSLGFLGSRRPDREKWVDQLFLVAASALPDHRFLLGGSGWTDKPMPHNVNYVGHVYARDQNAFNTGAIAVLNISRDLTDGHGFSPATRIFEAAGAGACLVTDPWNGLEQFLEPGREVLIANDGHQVAERVATLTPLTARAIGQRARARMLREHTYAHRAIDVEAALGERTRMSRTGAHARA